MLHKRPHNKFEDLESVYLVGGGTHPGSGLPVIYESSRITCRQLLSEFDLPNGFIDELKPLGRPSPLETTLANHG
jgi:phytoene desaturase